MVTAPVPDDDPSAEKTPVEESDVIMNEAQLKLLHEMTCHSIIALLHQNAITH